MGAIEVEAGSPTLDAPPKRPFYSHLYVQVLIAIALGVLLGHFYPALGEQMKPLGDGFIKLIKMIIAPIIFLTVVHGIASMSNLKAVGSVGIKALVYFEIVTTFALIIGLLVANIARPGEGMNIDLSTVDSSAVAEYVAKAEKQSTVEFLLDIIPKSVVGAFVEGNILQVLLFALLFAFALQALGERGITRLLVEGGGQLAASLLRAGLVDELLVYLAPKLLGLGREMAAFGPLHSLAEAPPSEF